jgi:S-DNA-T family DNA segregation ATPase FtsK/SpoIIIE
MGARSPARRGVLANQDVAPRSSSKPRKSKIKAARAEKLRSRSAEGAGRSSGSGGGSGLIVPSAHVWRGVGAVLVLALAVACVLATISFHAAKPAENLIGRSGHALAKELFDAVGICAYLVPFPLFSLTASLATNDPTQRHWPRLFALVVLSLSCASLAQIVVGTHPGQDYPPGGSIGVHLDACLISYLSVWGATLAISAIAASALVVASDGWLVKVGVMVGRVVHGWELEFRAWGWVRLQELAKTFEQQRQQRKQERVEEAAYMAQLLADEEAEAEAEDEDEADLDETESDASEAEAATNEADQLAHVSDANRGLTEAHAETESDADPLEVESAPKKRKSRREAHEQDPAWALPDSDSATSANASASDAPTTMATAAAPAPGEKRRRGKAKDADKTADANANANAGMNASDAAALDKLAASSPLPKIVVAPKRAPEEVPFDEGEVELLASADPADTLAARTSIPPKSADASEAERAPAKANANANAEVDVGTPAIIERPTVTKVEPRKKKPGEFEMADGRTSFVLPPTDCLDLPEEKKQLRMDKEVFFATAEKLRLKLKDFGIEGEVKEIHPGPVVTMYEFVPGPGIKISKIASLADDLAMAMEALRVRIVAPIPGKGSVGIEVPNKERETVYLKEIVESDRYAGSPSKLTMCLGKNIEGLPYVMDLAKAPHLLMAGTTGSGKSVSVNSMITSILLKATPEEVRFIMVDPKMLELSIYEGIPHLLLPVVTDSKKAALALRWAVEEMERRYQLLSDVGVRNLAGYNKLVETGTLPTRRQAPEPKADAKIVVDVNEGAPVESQPAESEAAPETPKKLPYIVVIIDELADLMMVASREVETYIARLAQMARAAGIHLMVATQRPSTDVVTGVIKANFPSRISFMLRSKPDSMTILGQTGAEALLGMGDMLVQPPTDANVIRVHGAYVSETEIKKVVDHLKGQGKPVYDESILRPREEEGAGDGEGIEDDLSDELYDQALAIVSEMKDISISVLQRKMRIGYNRSARMIERMERDGVVGPADGSKPRKVLIRPVGQMGM